ncbi:hypothetical protein NA57DRAFT_56469 [Rhizodiscina lignyota]|uniref:Uncharacterized protein n=1 Tax=Rhizodiscina lignyota TaxID=1504668 RepID=A0A9P4M5L1_9PEZI|nr:hypothetical protein NA57DRAFT_56469 [Rhizodiscina lignyota]
MESNWHSNLSGTGRGGAAKTTPEANPVELRQTDSLTKGIKYTNFIPSLSAYAILKGPPAFCAAIRAPDTRTMMSGIYIGEFKWPPLSHDCRKRLDRRCQTLWPGGLRRDCYEHCQFHFCSKGFLTFEAALCFDKRSSYTSLRTYHCSLLESTTNNGLGLSISKVIVFLSIIMALQELLNLLLSFSLFLDGVSASGPSPRAIQQSTSTFVFADPTVYLQNTPKSAPTDTPDLKINDMNRDGSLDIFVGSALSNRLKEASIYCEQLNESLCLESVLEAVDPDTLDLEVRSLVPTIGLSTPKVSPTSPAASFFVAIVAFFAYLWRAASKGHTDPRLGNAGYVHLKASDVSKIHAWPATGTIAFATATKDAFAIKVSMPPVQPTATPTNCDNRADCPKDENRIDCDQCDGFNTTCRQTLSSNDVKNKNSDWSKWDDWKFVFQWKSSGAECGELTCQDVFAEFLIDKDCTPGENILNIGGERDTWCGHPTKSTARPTKTHSTATMSQKSCNPPAPTYTSCTQPIPTGDIGQAAQSFCDATNNSTINKIIITNPSGEKPKAANYKDFLHDGYDFRYLMTMSWTAKCTNTDIQEFSVDDCTRKLQSVWSDCYSVNKGTGGQEIDGCVAISFKPMSCAKS